MLKYHIQTINVGTVASPTLTFSSIPQDYDDLLLVISPRSTTGPNPTSIGDGIIYFNNVTSGYSGRLLFGQGSGGGNSGSYSNLFFWYPSSNATANTFGSTSVYIPNYATSNAKVTSQEIVSESNETFAYNMIFAGIWNNTSPINSITVQMSLTNFAQHSSASLYGIRRGSDGVTGTLPAAQGGIVVTSGGFTYHTFTSSGTFVANRELNTEVLVVAGGGGGGCDIGGAGGAGGVLGATSQIVSRGNNLVLVGAGGAQQTSAGIFGNNGTASVFGALNAIGGGGGGGYNSGATGRSGGSGGGSTFGNPATGGAGTPGQGNNGGGATGGGTPGAGGGYGGPGGAGTSSGAANGGPGSSTITNLGSISAWLSATGIGVSGLIAGGGSGANNTASGTVSGGGGPGARLANPSGQIGSNGTANTGGGGGSGGNAAGAGGAGGSGVVIIRYPTPAS